MSSAAAEKDSMAVVVEKESRPHCHFYVMKKKRFCRMTVKEGGHFCGEHIDVPQQSESQDNKKVTEKLRVPCPYDSKHSCFKHQLRKHIARCNSKPGATPDFIVPGLNEGESEINPTRIPLNDLSDEYLMEIIGKIRKIHEDFVKINECIKEHIALAEELKRPDFGAPALKHLVQNSSLLGIMETYGLLKNNTCYVEMGAGKGKLTYWLAQAVKDLENCTFALVDRASYRHKNENKLKTPDFEPSRIRADIADLCLRQVSCLDGCNNVVAVSKHLCGAATDLALRCVANTLQHEETSNWDMRGLVMALCCHHRCDWKHYVGKQFFTDVGLSSKDFTTMSVLVSWATCGSGRSRDPQRQDTKPESTVETENKHRDRYVRLNLPQEIREEVGKKCKHIIDFGRNHFLQSIGFKSELIFYVSQNITLENVSIVATKF